MNIFSILKTKNGTVKWVIVGAVFFLVLTLNVPFLLDMFQFAKVGIGEFLLCSAAGALSIAWFEIYKQVKKSKML